MFRCASRTTKWSLKTAVFVLLAIASSVAPTSASITAVATNNPGNAAGTDSLERLIDITPGSDVRPGTATPVASGIDLSLSVDLGRVPDSHVFGDAIHITNTDSVGHTIAVSLVGAWGSVVAVEYLDGTTTKLIAPGNTEVLRVRTTTAVAGLESGAIRFEEAGQPRFFRRDLPLATAQAPDAPTGLIDSSTPGPPTVALNWAAGASSGVAGYNVYRATAAAGPYVKLNAVPLVATTYSDTTVSPSTRYWYRVTAVASGVTPELEGMPSATTDGRVPPTPSSVVVAAGVGNTAGYVSIASAPAAVGRVVLPASTEAGDVVHVMFSDGTASVEQTALAAGGPQTLDVSPIDASALADGPIAVTAWITKPSELGSGVSGGATKDTQIGVTASFVAATAQNPANFINIATGVAPGTATGRVDLPASSMNTDTVDLRLTLTPATVTGTTTGTAGAGSALVTGLSTDGWAEGAVTVEARVRDLAGNDTGWIAGTNATRDTVAPAPPTAASIPATAVNPAGYVNIATVAAAGVSVTSGATAADTVQARLTSAGVDALSAQLPGAAVVAAPINASALADTAVGGLAVSARVYDPAGNPSTWFTGSAATKDTVAPNAPDFAQITFTDRAAGPDRVRGQNGAVGARDEVRIFDYFDATFYPAAWKAANNNGNFANITIARAGVPRTLGYEVRDAAWNPIARICRAYNASGSGIAGACP